MVRLTLWQDSGLVKERFVVIPEQTALQFEPAELDEGVCKYY